MQGSDSPRASKGAQKRTSTKRQSAGTVTSADTVPGVRVEPAPPRISACILARNEERHLPDALRSLQPLADEVFVIDHGSTDRTASIAAEYGARILPLSYDGRSNFDAARNLVIEHASGEWIFYLDADERVPPRLGPLLRQLVAERGAEFSALMLPFKHYFCGKWIEHSLWGKSYTRPQLLKKGSFHYADRLHGGVYVEGRTLQFPADDPDLALIHYSYDDLHHYLQKLNRYTVGEAENFLADDAPHTWQAHIAHFVRDWQLYYETGHADRDGMHGFVLSFFSAFYRFASRAKLWDLRRQRGEADADEPVPGSAQEIVAFMEHVARHGAGPWLDPKHVPPPGRFAVDKMPASWRHGLTDADPIAPDAIGGGFDPDSPITACILARDAETLLTPAIQSLRAGAWCREILLLDNESEDGTEELARRLGARVVAVPRWSDEDATCGYIARNLAIEHATGDWIFFLDADERVPTGLGPVLRRAVAEHGEEFAALEVPFRNIFYGKWMRSDAWWPGYKGPQLLHRDAFRFGPTLHAPPEVQGRALRLPGDDPDLAVRHDAYRDISEYLEKLNRYTDGEAAWMDAAGFEHCWQAQLAHFADDLRIHYDNGGLGPGSTGGIADGMHGFVQSVLCAFYRFAARAKIWDRRRKRGEWDASESVPGSLQEMLGFTAQILQEGPGRWLAPRDPDAGRRADSTHYPLVWHSPLFDASGYADEARNFVLGLLEAGEPLVVGPMRWGDQDAGLRPEDEARLRSVQVAPDAPCDIFVSMSLPWANRPSANARVSVVRTMFETDRIEPAWAGLLNAFDAVWVPAEFHREAFVRSGVSSKKIAVVPEAIDADAYRRDDLSPHPDVPGDPKAFRFLSVFDWTLHKGWDVLLEAFACEFGPDPAVELVLKVWSSNHYTLEDVKAQANAHLRSTVGRALTDLPNVHFWWEHIAGTDVPRIYRSVQCYVTPTRGEGWGRPLMEAMASGLPTIATAWSGVTAFHNSRVGYPVRYSLEPVSEAGAKELPIYRGHCWAEPDHADLQRRMRAVVSDPKAARRKGDAGRRHVLKHFNRAAVAEIVRSELRACRALAGERATQSGPEDLLPRSTPTPSAAPPPVRQPANPVSTDPAAPVDFAAALGRTLRVQWEGDLAVISSLSLVNREFCLQLAARSDVALTTSGLRRFERDPAIRDAIIAGDPRLAGLMESGFSANDAPADVTVRHFFPADLERPAGGGKFVVMQPWEWGHAPVEWARAMASDAVDEVWANSRFVRDVYVRSGVPAEKVRIVPLGVRCLDGPFTPDGPRLALPTYKTTRLLYVGGTIHRKGADLLLRAYRRAFSRSDDVCLVVKDMGARSFYYGQNYGDAFRAAAADASGPEVLYLGDPEMTAENLAALYRSCTAVVHPYRSEGFALSPLEGMACGLPAIVTAGGPTDDYLDDTMALRVPSRIIHTGANRHGNGFCVGDPWYLEPDADALVDALRWLRDHPEETRTRGAAARVHVAQGWNWDRATGVVCERLAALTGSYGAAAPSDVRKFNGGVSTPAVARRSRPIELSLCMIARDEEPRIGKCLGSIAPYVDEMIVLDTGSTDRTRDVAATCGARVYETVWPDSFSEARNRSLEFARGRWIFWMDADDEISPECGAGLKELVRRHPDGDAAYQVQVRIPPGAGEWGETIVDHVKLFPNRPDLRFEHRIHEQILPALRQAGIPVLFSDIYVTHSHYDRSATGQTKKRKRDFRLLEMDLRDRPGHPFVLFNLGMTHLFATKEYEVAAQYLERCLVASRWQDSIVRKGYALLTTAQMCLHDWSRALAANENGRRYYPADPELLFQAGQIYQHVRRFDDARAALERLVGRSIADGAAQDWSFAKGVADAESPHYRSVDTGLETYRGWHELALLHRRMGDADHCERVLRQVLQQRPGYVPAVVDLADTLEILGRTSESQLLRNDVQQRLAIGGRSER